MREQDIIKQIRSFNSKPEVVRGDKEMTLLCMASFGGDNEMILNAIRECRDIIESAQETIKFDYMGQRNYIEFVLTFKSKPLESIRITREFNNAFMNSDEPYAFCTNKDVVDGKEYITSFRGRKVEIID